MPFFSTHSWSKTLSFLLSSNSLNYSGEQVSFFLNKPPNTISKMKIHDLEEIVNEIKQEGKKVDNKDKWWAGKGKHNDFGNDWFLGHPDVGLYQFKSYNKNPYTQKGVGTKLTKNVDDDLKKNFEEENNSIFGVLPDKIKKKSLEREKRKDWLKTKHLKIQLVFSKMF
ncbi:hypothetical protein C9439_02885 [archaeon SCG-AAA382B04]|nr:hypothetical protein C9439_02885 [archaeon SCG-AAA382B04]